MNARFIQASGIALVVMGLGLAAADRAAAQDVSNQGEGVIAYSRVCEIDPGWNVSASATWFQRAKTKGALLAREDFDPDSAPLLNANDFNFPVNTGADVSVIRRSVFSTPWSIEARFLRTDGEASSVGPNPAPIGVVVPYVIPIGMVTESPDDTISARYNWVMQGGEVNARHPWGECFTLIAGFRYFQINDTGLDITQIGYLGTPQQFTINHHLETTNDLYGGQIGLAGQLFGNGRLGFDGFCKAGLYGNSATSYAYLTNTASPTTFETSGSQTKVAFLGEAGISFSYYLFNGVIARAGYSLIWGEGIATAPNQIHVMDPFTGGKSPIDSSGTLIVHGANAGLEVKF